MKLENLHRKLKTTSPWHQFGFAFSQLLMLTVALICFAFSSTTFATEKPNILFIFLDDFGWRDASYMGSDFYETPHIDALAAQGMIFSDAYSGAANCAPARACLLSGQYTPRHQIYNVGTEPRGNSAFRRLIPVGGTSVLNPEIRTWAQQIQAAGYTTGTFGKWHFPAYLQSYEVYHEQRDPLFRCRPCSIIREGDWKLHQYFEDGALELYNLRDDIGEVTDLSKANPDKTQQMLTRLQTWQQQTGAEIPTEANPDFDAAAEEAAIEKANRGGR